MPRYYEIEVSLREINPKIWRRFHLCPDATFQDLNDAIQFCGPWDDAHLWEFRYWGTRGKPFAAIRYDGWQSDLSGDEPPCAAAEDVMLTQVLKKKGDHCLYVYDFGDNWEHEVKLRRVVESDDVFARRIVAGGGNFPPEDAGGTYGYYLTCHALGKLPWPDPDRPPHPDMLEDRREWMPSYDPEAFDLGSLKTKYDRPTPRRGKGEGLK